MAYLGRVVTGLLKENDKYLVGLRPLGKPAAGFVEFAGGKAELNETLEEALKREYKEETDLDIEVGELLWSDQYTFGDGTYDVYMFNVTIQSGTPTCKVHQWLKWLTKEEIEQYPHVPSLFPVLKNYEKLS